jgi:hypothetical protein
MNTMYSSMTKTLNNKVLLEYLNTMHSSSIQNHGNLDLFGQQIIKDSSKKDIG